MPGTALTDVGIVAIGRNEGARLARCLASVSSSGATVVYVDSNSSDGSVELARSMGIDVVLMDASRPLSAARARNEGLARLAMDPAVRFVQFIDGDSEMVDGWIAHASAALELRPDAAMICGRLRERHPGASIYNRICQVEWDRPAGDVNECGGIAMVRVAAFQETGGFDPAVIAGEEPELCLRLRQRGWKILRVGREMAIHDAAILRFAQWWRRAVRCGHAYAQGKSLHGRPPERHCVREVRRAWVWAFFVPVAALAALWLSRGASAALLLAYPAQAVRVFRAARASGTPTLDAAAYAAACVVGKVPELVGILKFRLRKLCAAPLLLIEHK